MNPNVSSTNEELARARAELTTLGADWALLSTAENVSYVSHFEVPVEFGASAAQRYAAPMAFLGITESTASLLVSDGYASGAKAQTTFADVFVHEVFALDHPVSPRDNFLNSVRDTFRKAGLNHGKAKLAVEERTLPMAVQRLLTTEFPNIELIEAGPALDTARLIKTARELDLLRAAAEVNRAGHTELLKQCEQAGKNELAMWSAVIHAMEQKGGHPLMVFGELVTGKRCGAVNYPGGPKDRITEPGDLALMDMSPRVHGYWSDCTNTMVIGGVAPTEQQKRYGVAAREAFHAAADKLRPGRKAHEAFDAAQATFARHGLQIGHYGGHQIGLSVNENPRLVPFEQTVIQAGMVFSIEPGAYQGPGGDTGARMEKSIIVRNDGPELLCDFVWGF